METKTLEFTFAFDPQWDEQVLFKKFKKVIKSNIIYYKYKMYLKELTRLRKYRQFLTEKQRQNFDMANDGLPIFWSLGELLYSSYKRNKDKTDAIVFRCYWSVEIDEKTSKEKITNIFFFDYSFDKTILDVY